MSVQSREPDPGGSSNKAAYISGEVKKFAESKEGKELISKALKFLGSDAPFKESQYFRDLKSGNKSESDLVTSFIVSFPNTCRYMYLTDTFPRGLDSLGEIRNMAEVFETANLGAMLPTQAQVRQNFRQQAGVTGKSGKAHLRQTYWRVIDMYPSKQWPKETSLGPVSMCRAVCHPDADENVQLAGVIITIGRGIWNHVPDVDRPYVFWNGVRNAYIQGVEKKDPTGAVERPKEKAEFAGIEVSWDDNIREYIVKKWAEIDAYTIDHDCMKICNNIYFEPGFIVSYCPICRNVIPGLVRRASDFEPSQLEELKKQPTDSEIMAVASKFVKESWTDWEEDEEPKKEEKKVVTITTYNRFSLLEAMIEGGDITEAFCIAPTLDKDLYREMVRFAKDKMENEEECLTGTTRLFKAAAKDRSEKVREMRKEEEEENNNVPKEKKTFKPRTKLQNQARNQVKAKISRSLAVSLTAIFKARPDDGAQIVRWFHIFSMGNKVIKDLIHHLEKEGLYERVEWQWKRVIEARLKFTEANSHARFVEWCSVLGHVHFKHWTQWIPEVQQEERHEAIAEVDVEGNTEAEEAFASVINKLQHALNGNIRRGNATPSKRNGGIKKQHAVVRGKKLGQGKNGLIGIRDRLARKQHKGGLQNRKKHHRARGSGLATREAISIRMRAQRASTVELVEKKAVNAFVDEMTLGDADDNERVAFDVTTGEFVKVEMPKTFSLKRRGRRHDVGRSDRQHARRVIRIAQEEKIAAEKAAEVEKKRETKAKREEEKRLKKERAAAYKKQRAEEKKARKQRAAVRKQEHEAYLKRKAAREERKAAYEARCKRRAEKAALSKKNEVPPKQVESEKNVAEPTVAKSCGFCHKAYTCDKCYNGCCENNHLLSCTCNAKVVPKSMEEVTKRPKNVLEDFALLKRMFENGYETVQRGQVTYSTSKPASGSGVYKMHAKCQNVAYDLTIRMDYEKQTAENLGGTVKINGQQHPFVQPNDEPTHCWKPIAEQFGLELANDAKQPAQVFSGLSYYTFGVDGGNGCFHLCTFGRLYHSSEIEAKFTKIGYAPAKVLFALTGSLVLMNLTSARPEESVTPWETGPVRCSINLEHYVGFIDQETHSAEVHGDLSSIVGAPQHCHSCVRHPGDERGHVIAKSLGGPGACCNCFSISDAMNKEMVDIESRITNGSWIYRVQWRNDAVLKFTTMILQTATSDDTGENFQRKIIRPLGDIEKAREDALKRLEHKEALLVQEIDQAPPQQPQKGPNDVVHLGECVSNGKVSCCRFTEGIYDNRCAILSQDKGGEAQFCVLPYAPNHRVDGFVTCDQKPIYMVPGMRRNCSAVLPKDWEVVGKSTCESNWWSAQSYTFDPHSFLRVAFNATDSNSTIIIGLQWQHPDLKCYDCFDDKRDLAQHLEDDVERAWSIIWQHIAGTGKRLEADVKNKYASWTMVSAERIAFALILLYIAHRLRRNAPMLSAVFIAIAVSSVLPLVFSQHCSGIENSFWAKRPEADGQYDYTFGQISLSENTCVHIAAPTPISIQFNNLMSSAVYEQQFYVVDKFTHKECCDFQCDGSTASWGCGYIDTRIDPGVELTYKISGAHWGCFWLGDITMRQKCAISYLSSIGIIWREREAASYSASFEFTCGRVSKTVFIGAGVDTPLTCEGLTIHVTPIGFNNPHPRSIAQKSDNTTFFSSQYMNVNPATDYIVNEQAKITNIESLITINRQTDANQACEGHVGCSYHGQTIDNIIQRSNAVEKRLSEWPSATFEAGKFSAKHASMLAHISISGVVKQVNHACKKVEGALISQVQVGSAYTGHLSSINIVNRPTTDCLPGDSYPVVVSGCGQLGTPTCFSGVQCKVAVDCRPGRVTVGVSLGETNYTLTIQSNATILTAIGHFWNNVFNPSASHDTDSGFFGVLGNVGSALGGFFGGGIFGIFKTFWKFLKHIPELLACLAICYLLWTNGEQVYAVVLFLLTFVIIGAFGETNFARLEVAEVTLSLAVLSSFVYYLPQIVALVFFCVLTDYIVRLIPRLHWRMWVLAADAMMFVIAYRFHYIFYVYFLIRYDVVAKAIDIYRFRKLRVYVVDGLPPAPAPTGTEFCSPTSSKLAMGGIVTAQTLMLGFIADRALNSYRTMSEEELIKYSIADRDVVSEKVDSLKSELAEFQAHANPVMRIIYSKAINRLNHDINVLEKVLASKCPPTLTSRVLSAIGFRSRIAENDQYIGYIDRSERSNVATTAREYLRNNAYSFTWSTETKCPSNGGLGEWDQRSRAIGTNSRTVGVNFPSGVVAGFHWSNKAKVDNRVEAQKDLHQGWSGQISGSILAQALFRKPLSEISYIELISGCASLNHRFQLPGISGSIGAAQRGASIGASANLSLNTTATSVACVGAGAVLGLSLKEPTTVERGGKTNFRPLELARVVNVDHDDDKVTWGHRKRFVSFMKDHCAQPMLNVWQRTKKSAWSAFYDEEYKTGILKNLPKESFKVTELGLDLEARMLNGGWTTDDKANDCSWSVRHIVGPFRSHMLFPFHRDDVVSTQPQPDLRTLSKTDDLYLVAGPNASEDWIKLTPTREGDPFHSSKPDSITLKCHNTEKHTVFPGYSGLPIVAVSKDKKRAQVVSACSFGFFTPAGSVLQQPTGEKVTEGCGSWLSRDTQDIVISESRIEFHSNNLNRKRPAPAFEMVKMPTHSFKHRTGYVTKRNERGFATDTGSMFISARHVSPKITGNYGEVKTLGDLMWTGDFDPTKIYRRKYAWLRCGQYSVRMHVRSRLCIKDGIVYAVLRDPTDKVGRGWSGLPLTDHGGKEILGCITTRDVKTGEFLCPLFVAEDLPKHRTLKNNIGRTIECAPPTSDIDQLKKLLQDLRYNREAIDLINTMMQPDNIVANDIPDHQQDDPPPNTVIERFEQLAKKPVGVLSITNYARANPFDWFWNRSTERPKGVLPPSVNIIRFNNHRCRCFGYVYKKTIVTPHHASRGRALEWPAPDGWSTFGEPTVYEDSDIDLYNGSEFRDAEPVAGKIYVVINPVSRMYSLLKCSTRTDSGTLYLYRIDDKGNEISSKPLAGWSGLPIIDIETPGVVGMYSMHKWDGHSFGTMVPTNQQVAKHYDWTNDVSTFIQSTQREFDCNAPTGSGKSTMLPLLLASTDKCGVCLLVPNRKVAEINFQKIVNLARQYKLNVDVSLKIGGMPDSRFLISTPGIASVVIATYGSGWVNYNNVSGYRYVLLDEIHKRQGEVIAMIERLSIDGNFNGKLIKLTATSVSAPTDWQPRPNITETPVTHSHPNKKHDETTYYFEGLPTNKNMLRDKKHIVFISSVALCTQYAKDCRADGINAAAFYRGAENETRDGVSISDPSAFFNTNETGVLFSTDILSSGANLPNLDFCHDPRYRMQVSLLQDHEKMFTFDGTGKAFAYGARVLERTVIDQNEGIQRRGRVGREPHQQGHYRYSDLDFVPANVWPNDACWSAAFMFASAGIKPRRSEIFSRFEEITEMQTKANGAWKLWQHLVQLEVAEQSRRLPHPFLLITMMGREVLPNEYRIADDIKQYCQSNFPNIRFGAIDTLPFKDTVYLASCGRAVEAEPNVVDNEVVYTTAADHAVLIALAAAGAHTVQQIILDRCPLMLCETYAAPSFIDYARGTTQAPEDAGVGKQTLIDFLPTAIRQKLLRVINFLQEPDVVYTSAPSFFAVVIRGVHMVKPSMMSLLERILGGGTVTESTYVVLKRIVTTLAAGIAGVGGFTFGHYEGEKTVKIRETFVHGITWAVLFERFGKYLADVTVRSWKSFWHAFAEFFRTGFSWLNDTFLVSEQEHADAVAKTQSDRRQELLARASIIRKMQAKLRQTVVRAVDEDDLIKLSCAMEDGVTKDFVVIEQAPRVTRIGIPFYRFTGKQWLGLIGTSIFLFVTNTGDSVGERILSFIIGSVVVGSVASVLDIPSPQLMITDLFIKALSAFWHRCRVIMTRDSEDRQLKTKCEKRFASSQRDALVSAMTLVSTSCLTLIANLPIVKAPCQALVLYDLYKRASLNEIGISDLGNKCVFDYTRQCYLEYDVKTEEYSLCGRIGWVEIGHALYGIINRSASPILKFCVSAVKFIAESFPAYNKSIGFAAALPAFTYDVYGNRIPPIVNAVIAAIIASKGSSMWVGFFTFVITNAVLAALFKNEKSDRAEYSARNIQASILSFPLVSWFVEKLRRVVTEEEIARRVAEVDAALAAQGYTNRFESMADSFAQWFKRPSEPTPLISIPSIRGAPEVTSFTARFSFRVLTGSVINPFISSYRIATAASQLYTRTGPQFTVLRRHNIGVIIQETASLLLSTLAHGNTIVFLVSAIAGSILGALRDTNYGAHMILVRHFTSIIKDPQNQANVNAMMDHGMDVSDNMCQIETALMSLVSLVLITYAYPLSFAIQAGTAIVSYLRITTRAGTLPPPIHIVIGRTLRTLGRSMIMNGISLLLTYLPIAVPLDLVYTSDDSESGFIVPDRTSHAVIIPAAEGKTRLANSSQSLFVEIDSLLGPSKRKELHTIKNLAKATGDFSPIAEFYRENVPPTSKIVLTSHPSYLPKNYVVDYVCVLNEPQSQAALESRNRILAETKGAKFFDTEHDRDVWLHKAYKMSSTNELQDATYVRDTYDEVVDKRFRRKNDNDWAWFGDYDENGDYYLPRLPRWLRRADDATFGILSTLISFVTFGYIGILDFEERPFISSWDNKKKQQYREQRGLPTHIYSDKFFPHELDDAPTLPPHFMQFTGTLPPGILARDAGYWLTINNVTKWPHPYHPLSKTPLTRADIEVEYETLLRQFSAQMKFRRSNWRSVHAWKGRLHPLVRETENSRWYFSFDNVSNLFSLDFESMKYVLSLGVGSGGAEQRLSLDLNGEIHGITLKNPGIPHASEDSVSAGDKCRFVLKNFSATNDFCDPEVQRSLREFVRSGPVGRNKRDEQGGGYDMIMLSHFEPTRTNPRKEGEAYYRRLAAVRNIIRDNLRPGGNLLLNVGSIDTCEDVMRDIAAHFSQCSVLCDVTEENGSRSSWIYFRRFSTMMRSPTFADEFIYQYKYALLVRLRVDLHNVVKNSPWVPWKCIYRAPQEKIATYHPFKVEHQVGYGNFHVDYPDGRSITFIDRGWQMFQTLRAYVSRNVNSGMLITWDQFITGSVRKDMIGKEIPPPHCEICGYDCQQARLFYSRQTESAVWVCSSNVTEYTRIRQARNLVPFFDERDFRTFYAEEFSFVQDYARGTRARPHPIAIVVDDDVLPSLFNSDSKKRFMTYPKSRCGFSGYAKNKREHMITILNDDYFNVENESGGPNPNAPFVVLKSYTLAARAQSVQHSQHLLTVFQTVEQLAAHLSNLYTTWHADDYKSTTTSTSDVLGLQLRQYVKTAPTSKFRVIVAPTGTGKSRVASRYHDFFIGTDELLADHYKQEGIITSQSAFEYLRKNVNALKKSPFRTQQIFDPLDYERTLPILNAEEIAHGYADLNREVDELVLGRSCCIVALPGTAKSANAKRFPKTVIDLDTLWAESGFATDMPDGIPNLGTDHFIPGFEDAFERWIKTVDIHGTRGGLVCHDGVRRPGPKIFLVQSPVIARMMKLKVVGKPIYFDERMALGAKKNRTIERQLKDADYRERFIALAGGPDRMEMLVAPQDARLKYIDLVLMAKELFAEPDAALLSACRAYVSKLSASQIITDTRKSIIRYLRECQEGRGARLGAKIVLTNNAEAVRDLVVDELLIVTPSASSSGNLWSDIVTRGLSEAEGQARWLAHQVQNHANKEFAREKKLATLPVYNFLHFEEVCLQYMYGRLTGKHELTDYLNSNVSALNVRADGDKKVIGVNLAQLVIEAVRNKLLPAETCVYHAKASGGGPNSGHWCRYPHLHYSTLTHSFTWACENDPENGGTGKRTWQETRGEVTSDLSHHDHHMHHRLHNLFHNLTLTEDLQRIEWLKSRRLLEIQRLHALELSEEQTVRANQIQHDLSVDMFNEWSTCDQARMGRRRFEIEGPRLKMRHQHVIGFIPFRRGVGFDKVRFNPLLKTIAEKMFGWKIEASDQGLTSKLPESLDKTFTSRLDEPEVKIKPIHQRDLMNATQYAVHRPTDAEGNRIWFNLGTWEDVLSMYNPRGATGFLERDQCLGDVIRSDAFKAEVMEEVERRKRGELGPAYISGMNKNEKKGRGEMGETLEEVEQDTPGMHPTPRLIQYFNHVQRVADLLIFAPMLKYHLQVRKLYWGSVTGTPIFNIGDKLHAAWLRYKRPAALCLDQKRYDHHEGRFIIATEYMEIMDMYSSDPEVQRALKTTCERDLTPIVVSKNGDILMRNGQRSSGHQLTSFGNGMVNSRLIRVGVARALGIPPKDVDQVIDFFCEGDDSVIIGEYETIRLIESSITKIMTDYGFVVTGAGALKNESGVKTKFEEIDFLSHRFMPVRVRGADGSSSIRYLQWRPMDQIIAKLVLTTKIGAESTHHPKYIQLTRDLLLSFLILYNHLPDVRSLCAAGLMAVGWNTGHRVLFDNNVITRTTGCWYDVDHPMSAIRSVYGNGVRTLADIVSVDRHHHIQRVETAKVFRKHNYEVEANMRLQNYTHAKLAQLAVAAVREWCFDYAMRVERVDPSTINVHDVRDPSMATLSSHVYRAYHGSWLSAKNISYPDTVAKLYDPAKLALRAATKESIARNNVVFITPRLASILPREVRESKVVRVLNRNEPTGEDVVLASYTSTEPTDRTEVAEWHDEVAKSFMPIDVDRVISTINAFSLPEERVRSWFRFAWLG